VAPAVASVVCTGSAGRALAEVARYRGQHERTATDLAQALLEREEPILILFAQRIELLAEPIEFVLHLFHIGRLRGGNGPCLGHGRRTLSQGQSRQRERKAHGRH
jgi:hypothetical protein